MVRIESYGVITIYHEKVNDTDHLSDDGLTL